MFLIALALFSGVVPTKTKQALKSERQPTETEFEFNELYNSIQSVNLKLMAINTDLESYEQVMEEDYQTAQYEMHTLNEELGTNILRLQSKILGVDSHALRSKNTAESKKKNLELSQIVDQLQNSLESTLKENQVKYKQALKEVNELYDKIKQTDERPLDSSKTPPANLSDTQRRLSLPTKSNIIGNSIIQTKNLQRTNASNQPTDKPKHLKQNTTKRIQGKVAPSSSQLDALANQRSIGSPSSKSSLSIKNSLMTLKPKVSV